MTTYPRTSLTDAGTLAGRLLLGAIFVWSGYGKALAATATTAYFGKLGLPLPDVAYALTVAVELGVGLMFVLGVLFRPAALILAAFSVATAVVAHTNFADRAQLIQFYKNLAISGGFLYAALLGPGRISIDAMWRGRRG